MLIRFFKSGQIIVIKRNYAVGDLDWRKTMMCHSMWQLVKKIQGMFGSQ